ncbi:unnamed protein product [marine sediment metagenome]|uniref:Uncharacterized protein n=1 Tax=marine sediment metagenome TaxID=412755 RepID=X1HV02_9ZZZZ
MSTSIVLNVQLLNQQLQPLVTACFWGAVATAIAVPVAGAIGGTIAGKLEKRTKTK